MFWDKVFVMLGLLGITMFALWAATWGVDKQVRRELDKEKERGG